MLIQNAEIFCGRAFLHGDIRFGETIQAIGRLEGPADLDAEGCYVIPGLVDIHFHGSAGADVSDGDAEGLHRMGAYEASRGVTS